MLDTTKYERQLNNYPKYITYEKTKKNNGANRKRYL